MGRLHKNSNESEFAIYGQVILFTHSVSFSKSELIKPQTVNDEYCSFSSFWGGVLFAFANWAPLTAVMVMGDLMMHYASW